MEVWWLCEVLEVLWGGEGGGGEVVMRRRGGWIFVRG